jgi:hypothetical protein
MELDDFKNTWEDISNQVEKQQNLNLKIFDKMKKMKFRSSLKKIILPEILGSVVCILCAVFIGFNFYKLNTVAYQIVGVVSILLLVILPAISVMSIHPLYQSVDLNKSYADTLKEFAVQKIKFCKLQKLNLTLSHLLLVTIILLSTKLFGRNDIADSPYFYIFSFSFGYIILLFFSKWVFKSYNKTIRKTEDLLNELAS